MSADPSIVEPTARQLRNRLRVKQMRDDEEIRRLLMLELIARHGLKLEQRGNAWRVTGRGVDLLTSDLALLNGADLLPESNHRER